MKGLRGSAIYFKVPDIHAAYAELQQKAVRFRGAPHLVHKTPTSELWLAEFSDPDGNMLALMSETKPSATP
jgi:methylmalonyl-CoA/ethylmalonyl-CoA epimerase